MKISDPKADRVETHRSFYVLLVCLSGYLKEQPIFKTTRIIHSDFLFFPALLRVRVRSQKFIFVAKCQLNRFSRYSKLTLTNRHE